MVSAFLRCFSSYLHDLVLLRDVRLQGVLDCVICEDHPAMQVDAEREPGFENRRSSQIESREPGAGSRGPGVGSRDSRAEKG